MPENTLIKIEAQVEGLQNSLIDIANKLDKIDAASKRTGQSITNNFRKAAAGQQKRIDSWKTELGLIEKLEADIRRWAAAVKRATSTKDIERYNRNIAKATAEMKRLGTIGVANINKVNRRASAGVQVFNRLRTTMIATFGVFGAIRFIKNSVNVVAEFEQGMAAVRAITGATGDELERLSDLAKNIGGIFSPVEITKLEVKLAKLGFTISEIVDMTQGIVNLSIATGEDLSKAAELTASTIRGLGLDASETINVVDQLGKSFVSSGLDLNKYRESIKFIAPIAKDMGIELSAIVGILGKLADRQIFGSLAGTALRRVLIRMGDSSSKLSKRLGFTVNSSEDLINAFIKLKKEGTTFEQLLKLVDVRSLTATSALIDNAESLKDYITEIENANGAIEEMADIQLDTLQNQTKRAQASWEAFLVSMQDSGGTFKNVASAWADMLDAMRRGLTDEAKLIDEEIARIVEDARERMAGAAAEGQFGNVLGLDIKVAEKNLELLRSKSKKVLSDIDAFFELPKAIQFLRILEFKKLTEEFGELGTLITGEEKKIAALRAVVSEFRQIDIVKQEITKFDTEFQKLEKSGVKTTDALVKAFDKVGGKIKDDLAFVRLVPLADPKAQADLEKNLQGQLDAVTKHFDKLLKLSLAEEQKVRDKSAKNAADLLKLQKAALKREFEIAKLRASLIDDEFEKRAFLADAQNNFDVGMAKLTISNVKDRNEKIILLEESHAKKIAKITQDATDKQTKKAKDDFETAEKLARQKFETELELLKTAGASEERIRQRQIEFEIQLLRLRIANAKALGLSTDEIAQLTAEIDTLGASLENIQEVDPTEGLLNKWKDFIGEFSKLAREVGGIAKSIADAQVRSADRAVDALNTKFAETQRALQAEIALNEQGFASNVALRQKELEDIEEKRKKALKDQEAALKTQAAIESATQAINLVTSVSSIFKSATATFGIFGVVAAIAAAAALYSAFQKLKGSASEVTKLEKGGWKELGGKRHSGGGVDLGTVGEGEQGEIVSVFNRGAVKKNRKLITSFTDAVNKNQFDIKLDQDSTSGIGDHDVNVKSAVSLDKSSQIKEMNVLLKKNLRKVEIRKVGNTTIMTRGTSTRIIRHG